MLVLAVKHRLALNCSPPASAFQVLRLQLFTPHLASRKFLHTRASLEVALKFAGLGGRSGDGGRWRVGGGAKVGVVFSPTSVTVTRSHFSIALQAEMRA